VSVYTLYEHTLLTSNGLLVCLRCQGRFIYCYICKIIYIPRIKFLRLFEYTYDLTINNSNTRVDTVSEHYVILQLYNGINKKINYVKIRLTMDIRQICIFIHVLTVSQESMLKKKNIRSGVRGRLNIVKY